MLPLVPIAALAAGWIALRPRDGALDSSGGDAVTSYAPNPAASAWTPLIAAEAPMAGLSVPFVEKWIEVESGWNVCSVGNLKTLGPDGNPREMGLTQIYNPDDCTALGTSGSELRAVCVPGTQKLARALTGAEMLRHVRLSIAHIVKIRSAVIRKSGALDWPHDSRDFYKLVKLQHGLPALVTSGLSETTKKLGRAPASWAEFRSTVLTCDLPANCGQRSDQIRILDNAEKTGAAA